MDNPTPSDILKRKVQSLFSRLESEPYDAQMICPGAASYPWSANFTEEQLAVQRLVTADGSLTKQQIAQVQSVVDGLQQRELARHEAIESARASFYRDQAALQRRLQAQLEQAQQQVHALEQAAQTARESTRVQFSEASLLAPPSSNTHPVDDASENDLGSEHAAATSLSIGFSTTGLPKDSEISKIKGQTEDSERAKLVPICDELLHKILTNASGQHALVIRAFSAANVGLNGDPLALGAERFQESYSQGRVPLSEQADTFTTKIIDMTSMLSPSPSIDSGGDSSDSMNDPRDRKVHSDPDFAAAVKLVLPSILDGSASGLPRSKLDHTTRTFSVNGGMILFAARRKVAQARLVDAMLISIETLLHAQPGVVKAAEMRALVVEFKDLLQHPRNNGELDASEVDAALVLFSFVEKNMFVFNNLLAKVRELSRSRHYTTVVSDLGQVLSEFSVLPLEHPKMAFQRMTMRARDIMLPEAFDLSKFGFVMGNGHPEVFSPNAIACITILGTFEQLSHRSAAERDCISVELHLRALKGSATTDDVQTLFLSLENISYHPQAKPIFGTDPSSAFASYSGDNKGGGRGVLPLKKWNERGDKGGKGKNGGGQDGHVGHGKGKGAKGKGAKGTPILDGGGHGGDTDGSRGRRDERGGSKVRSSSALPGEENGVGMYKRAVETAGLNFTNLQVLASDVSSYFQSIGKPCPFAKDGSGAFQMPLMLSQGYHWKPGPTSHNFDVRRDIHGAMQFFRDISTGGTKGNQQCNMSPLGSEYMEKYSNRDWKVLTKAEFEAIYRPAVPAVPTRNINVKIRGVDVILFKA